MRVLRFLARVMLILALLLGAVLAYFYFSTTVQIKGEVRLKGLTGDARVTRDAQGVAHIKASTDQDAVFALGYTHAQDRLWQMEFQRRIGAGRLSEVLGKAALEQDKFLRTWGFYRAAQADLPRLSQRSRTMLEAYSAGVNARIAQGKLPLEFTILRFKPAPWTPTDSLVWQKMMAFDLNDSWETERDNALLDAKLGRERRKQLEQEAPENGPSILSKADLEQSGIQATGETVEPARATTSARAALAAQTLRQLAGLENRIADLGFQPMVGKGSNSWVVSGRFTQSGKPILSDDPHLTMSAPSLWYLASLEGKTLKVVGATIPGLPAVVIGRNERIAWGVTNFGNDAQDLFLEPAGVALTDVEEIIKVKDGPDVRLTVRSSARGPIISEVITGVLQRVALSWPALQPGDTTLDAFLEINYAQNWTEFRGAMRQYVSPSQNFIYADVDGNIGYIAPGKMPIRAGMDGETPVSSEVGRWTGFVPFERLPQVYNPPEGFIVTANHKAIPASYPYRLGGEWAAPWRAERILERLSELKTRGKITPDDMRSLQMDQKSRVWELFKAQMLSVTPSSGGTKDLETRALEQLRNWDGIMGEKSVPASIFAAWYKELSRMPRDEIADPQFGEYRNNPYFLSQQLEQNGTFCKAPGIPDCKTLLSSTFKVAIADLERRLGGTVSNWEWGKLHRAEMRHGALNSVQTLREVWTRSSSNGGGFATVNVAGYDQDTFTQTHGPGYRQVVDLANMNSSSFMIHLGQSGNPLSSHYADLLRPWHDGKTLNMTLDDVGGDTLVLKPE